MDWTLLPLTAVYVVTIAILTLGNTFLIAKAKRTVTFKWFMVVQVGFFLWLLGAFMTMLAPKEYIALLSAALSHSGIILLSWGWSLLGWLFSGGILPEKYKLVQGIIAITMILFAATNSLHQWYMTELTLTVKEPGILLWVSTGFIVVNFGCGMIGFWKSLAAAGRTQRLAVPLAGAVMATLAVFSLAGGFRSGGEVFPVAAYFVFILITLINWDNLFIDISPVSLHSFMNLISDAVVITDDKNNIIDANNMGRLSLFVSDKDRQSVVQLVEQLKKYIVDPNSSILGDVCGLYHHQLQGEIALEKANDSVWFSIYATPLFDKGNSRIGGVIIFHDITLEKRLIMELDEKNALLREANIQLTDYVKIANRLEEEEEKARIAMEIQNSLGQKMVEILAVMEVLKLSLDKDRQLAKENLHKAINACRDALSEVRLSVARIMPGAIHGKKGDETIRHRGGGIN